MYPKTLQYLMGHSDISITMNTYTHLGLEDAVDEMNRMQQLESARKEQEALSGLFFLYERAFRHAPTKIAGEFQ